jgi:hypothetical protein
MSAGEFDGQAAHLFAGATADRHGNSDRVNAYAPRHVSSMPARDQQECDPARPQRRGSGRCDGEAVRAGGGAERHDYLNRDFSSDPRTLPPSPHTVGCVRVDARACRDYDWGSAGGRQVINEEVSRGRDGGGVPTYGRVSDDKAELAA